jgi:hypothetical protein
MERDGHAPRTTAEQAVASEATEGIEKEGKSREGRRL